MVFGALFGVFSMEADAASSFFFGGGLAGDWSKVEGIYLPDNSKHSENLNMIGGILSLGSWIDMNASLWRFAGVINVSLTGNESTTYHLGGNEVKTTTNGVSPEFEFRIGRVIGQDGCIVFLSGSGRYMKSKLEAKKPQNQEEKVTSSRVCPTIGLGFASRVNFSNKIGWGACVNYSFRSSTRGTDYELKNKDSVGVRVFVTWNSL